MNRFIWFKRTPGGLIYLPVSWQGWAATAVYLDLVVEMFLRIDNHSHSASDTLIVFAPPFIEISILFILLCRASSTRRGGQP